MFCFFFWQLAVRTIVDLHKLYPYMVRVDLTTATRKDSTTQVGDLVYIHIFMNADNHSSYKITAKLKSGCVHRV